MDRAWKAAVLGLLIMVGLLAGCSSSNGSTSASGEPFQKTEPNDSIEDAVACIDEALQGTWLYDAEGQTQKAAFDHGKYTSLLIANGQEFVSIGVYDLSDGEIDTTTFNSNGSSVDGHLSYTYEEENLKLIAADGSYLVKISDDSTLTWGVDAIVNTDNREDIVNKPPADEDGGSEGAISSKPGIGTSFGATNAVAKAKQYLDVMAFSYTGLIEQLEYEGFSHDEAEYGANNCGADWDTQAVRKAAEYLDVMSFSRQELIEQLEYEGFTYEQAVYGVEQNGY